MQPPKDTIPYGFCHCGCGKRTSISPRNDYRWGHVKGEPVRFASGHGPRKSGSEFTVTDMGYETPCWLWNLCLSSGYGVIVVDKQSKKAHRVYYENKYGEIEEGLEPDHLCRVTSCVNPDHMEAVPHATNVQRGAKAKLDWERVRLIRQRASSSSISQMARDFGVGRSAIREIVNGRTWKET